MKVVAFILALVLIGFSCSWLTVSYRKYLEKKEAEKKEGQLKEYEDLIKELKQRNAK